MFTLDLMLVGLCSFVAGVGILGLLLRKHPSKVNAEVSSRIVHFLFFAGFGAPLLTSVFYPGLTRLDQLVGLAPLPLKPFLLIVGMLLGIPGLYFLGISNKLLRSLGSGANAFRLTKHIVETDIYKRTRNPMSLGYYLCLLSIGFISGSTLLTLGILLGYIPAHILFLKFFEERELELRFGESYKHYKRKVPFLIPKLSADDLMLLGWGANAFRRTLLLGATAFVSTALLTVYIWVTTAQIIAPPGLRILDFIWRVFSWLRA